MHNGRSYTVKVELSTRSPFWQARMYLEGEGGTPRRWSTGVRVGTGAARKESERTALGKAQERASDIAKEEGKQVAAAIDDEHALENVGLSMMAYKRINQKRRKLWVQSLGQSLTAVVLPYFDPARDIRSIKRRHLEEFKAMLIERYGYTSSVNNHLIAIRQCLKHAKFVLAFIDEAPTIENLKLDIQNPNSQAAKDACMVLEPEQVKRYLAAFDLPREREQMEYNLFLLHVGLRKTEALSLKWSWVDWEAREINIPGDVRKGGQEQRNPTAMDDDVYKLLLERRGRERQPAKDRIWFQLNDSKYYYRNGKRHLRKTPPNDYDSARRRAAEKAGITGYRHHDARHTIASHMSRDGASEHDIMNQMNWSTTAMAVRYAHPTNERVHGWAHKVGSKFSTGAPSATASSGVRRVSATGSQGSRGELREGSEKAAKALPVGKRRKFKAL
jgi:integrase